MTHHAAPPITASKIEITCRKAFLFFSSCAVLFLSLLVTPTSPRFFVCPYDSTTSYLCLLLFSTSQSPVIFSRCPITIDPFHLLTFYLSLPPSFLSPSSFLFPLHDLFLISTPLPYFPLYDLVLLGCGGFYERCRARRAAALHNIVSQTALERIWTTQSSYMCSGQS